MSVALSPSVLNATVKVWSKRETLGTYREVVRSWSPVVGEERRRVQLIVNRERREDTGGGERVTGEWKLIGSKAMDVLEGDVVEVVHGRELGGKFLVDEHDLPGGTHTELVLTSYKGDLA